MEIIGLTNKNTVGDTRYKTLGLKWLYKQHLSHQSLLYLDSEIATKKV